MSRQRSDRLSVALLHTQVENVQGEAAVRKLADELDERGHRASVLSASTRGLPAKVLHRRGFTAPITHLPAATAGLLRDRYDLVHAFYAPDAVAALWWRRLTARPVVFTWSEPVTREGLADRRLRLRAVQTATENVDALMAASPSLQDGLRRWLAVEAEVLPLDDVLAHERHYLRLARQT